jgi:hypothetical protein
MGELIIVRTVCFIFRKTMPVDHTGESEGERSRLYRGCSSTSKLRRQGITQKKTCNIQNKAKV